jgi:hypothetical protein
VQRVAIGCSEWLDASVATSIDVRGDWRSKWRQLRNVCDLLVEHAHPTEAEGGLNNVALNLAGRK